MSSEIFIFFFYFLKNRNPQISESSIQEQSGLRTWQRVLKIVLKQINLIGFLSALNNQGKIWLSVMERPDIFVLLA